jgi:hypothetical protein
VQSKDAAWWYYLSAAVIIHAAHIHTTGAGKLAFSVLAKKKKIYIYFLQHKHVIRKLS